MIEAIIDAIRTGFWDTSVLSQQDFESINSAVLERINQALESSKTEHEWEVETERDIPDKYILSAIEQYFEFRSGVSPSRVQSLVDRGLITRNNWYNLTEAGEKLLRNSKEVHDGRLRDV